MTLAELKRKQAAGMIKGFQEQKPGALPAGARTKKTKPVGDTAKLFIEQQRIDSDVVFVKELEFSDDRNFRFDFAIPDLKVYIEYEGLVGTGRKGGHQTKAGYTKNCEKYNLAASMGWMGYRYTCRNYKQFEDDLKTILWSTKAPKTGNSTTEIL